MARLIALLWTLAGCVANAKVDRGLAVMQGAQCAACHTIPGVAAPDRTESCVGCHAWVKGVAQSPQARAVAMEIFPKWERYERNVRSYAYVPDLGAAAARLDPDWWAGFLKDPHDLRPGLDETMVRVNLSDRDLAAVTGWVRSQARTFPARPAPDAANVVRGEELFASRGCTACHTFGARHVGPGVATAPDLRHARDRMTDDAIVAWILAPSSVSPGATMPTMGLGVEEAVAVRDYLVLADPGGAPAAREFAAVTPVTRPVKWAEVEERVFGKICAHCHMDPAQNEGRRGPGNAGGFGWPATGIELQTPASIRKNGDAIVAAMLRRRDEITRDHVAPGEVPAVITRPEKPGMPLGLPAIPDEDIALVMGWLAQGGPE